ncbi:MAG: hypothetical protein NTX64_06445, partial [Elusimicrobia bacterium]|nr:hypothetical protein [Elusimicrobiota bacterium]
MAKRSGIYLAYMPWATIAQGLAVIVVGGAIGLWFFSAAPEEDAAPAQPVSLDGAVPRQPTQPLEPLDCRGVAELLASRGSNPELASFGAAFLAEPSLRALWEDYQRDNDLVGAIQKVNASRPFKLLFAAASSDPRFRAAVEQLLQDPQLTVTLVDAESRLRAKMGAAAPLQGLGTKGGRLQFLDVGEEIAGGGSEGQSARHHRRPRTLLILTFLATAGVGGAAFLWSRRKRRKTAPGKSGPAPGATNYEPAPGDAAAGTRAATIPGSGALALADRYDNVRVLGEGKGMQWVEARDLNLDRAVLIRRMTAYDAAFRERQTRAASIRHPALPHIYEIVEEGGALCIVYERWHGKSLAQLAPDGGQLPGSRAFELLEPVMRALEAAHAAGVYHGAISS